MKAFIESIGFQRPALNWKARQNPPGIRRQAAVRSRSRETPAPPEWMVTELPCRLVNLVKDLKSRRLDERPDVAGLDVLSGNRHKFQLDMDRKVASIAQALICVTTQSHDRPEAEERVPFHNGHLVRRGRGRLACESVAVRRIFVIPSVWRWPDSEDSHGRNRHGFPAGPGGDQMASNRGSSTRRYGCVSVRIYCRLRRPIAAQDVQK